MKLACLDLEGVLVPEIWINVDANHARTLDYWSDTITIRSSVQCDNFH